MIGGATSLAAGGVTEAGIKEEGRRTLSSFLAYVKDNMEDPTWICSVMEGGKGACNGQPGQGTIWAI